MNVLEYSEQRLMVPELLATEKQAAFKELSGRLRTCHCIADVDPFLWEIRAHEHVLYARTKSSVAFAYARGPFVLKPAFALGKSATGISFNASPQGTAHLLFLVATPDTRGKLHMVLISKLARLINDEECRAKLVRSQTPQQMYAALVAQQEATRVAYAQPSLPWETTK